MSKYILHFFPPHKEKIRSSEITAYCGRTYGDYARGGSNAYEAFNSIKHYDKFYMYKDPIYVICDACLKSPGMALALLATAGYDMSRE